MKKVMFLIASLIVATNVFSQAKEEFYIGGGAGLGTTVNGFLVSDKVTDVESFAAIGNAEFHFECGYFVADKLKLGAIFQASTATNTTSAYETAMGLASLGGSFAYYVEIAEGLYYVPEFVGSVLFSGYFFEDPLNFPLVGVSAALSFVQLEFRPTKHFATSVNLGSLGFTSAAGSVNYKGTTLDLVLANLNVALGVSPSVTFKYYF